MDDLDKKVLGFLHMRVGCVRCHVVVLMLFLLTAQSEVNSRGLNQTNLQGHIFRQATQWAAGVSRTHSFMFPLQKHIHTQTLEEIGLNGLRLCNKMHLVICNCA